MFGNLDAGEAGVSLLTKEVRCAPLDVIIVDWRTGAETWLWARLKPKFVPTRGDLAGANRAPAPS
jgi:hypothetical protein